MDERPRTELKCKDCRYWYGADHTVPLQRHGESAPYRALGAGP